MTRNVELLERTMQHISDHPENHAQEMWFSENDCGTAACFAGWACLLSGLEAVNAGCRSAEVTTPHGVHGVAAVEAKKLLGITHDEADIIFDANNSADMLRLMVKDLANGDDLGSKEFYEEEARR